MDNLIEFVDPDQQHRPRQKRFWSYIKSLRKDTGGVAPFKDNGRLHADPKEKADILNRQYESTWTRGGKTSITVQDGNPFPSMKNIQVTNEGITKLLQKLNPGKASGPDLLPARILKEFAAELSPYLSPIFQRSFDTGTVPKDWRTGNVTTIFKKGEQFKASNYRPVFLNSLCCKIQEHVITSNVLKHLESHDILTDC